MIIAYDNLGLHVYGVTDTVYREGGYYNMYSRIYTGIYLNIEVYTDCKSLWVSNIEMGEWKYTGDSLLYLNQCFAFLFPLKVTSIWLLVSSVRNLRSLLSKQPIG